MTEITTHRGIFGDIDLHVQDTGGEGRPVVLIHGWPLAGASWSEQVPALADAGYRVIAYDRRGFGWSDKPEFGYDYDHFAQDLSRILEALGLEDATLVGFSMGGGEVVRYLSTYGPARIRSVVLAAAIPPYLLKTDDNPEGPLEKAAADAMATALREDEEAFYDGFTTNFFSSDGELVVTEEQRQEALELTRHADKHASLKTMEAFGSTDFREELPSITVPLLILHGDADAIVPFEGSGRRVHDVLPDSTVELIAGGPHGVNVSHAAEFNERLLDFLAR